MAPKPKKTAKAKASTPIASESSESPQVRAARTRARNRELAANATAVAPPASISAPPASAGVVAASTVPRGRKRKSEPVNVGNAGGGQTIDTAPTVPSSKRAKAAAVPQRHTHPPRVELDDDLEIPPGFQGNHVLPQENTSFAAVGPFVFPDIDPEILPNMEDSDEDEDLDFVQDGQHDADELVALASSHPTKFKATIESERPQFWPDAAVRNQQLARSLASEIQPAMFPGLASDATAPTSSAVGEHPMTLHIAHQRFSVSPGLESAVSLSPMIETIVNPELLNPLPQASSSQAPRLSSQAPRLSSQAPRPSSQAPRPSSQAHLPLSQASSSQVSHLSPQIPPGNIPGLGAFGLNDPMVSDAAGPAGSGIFNLPPLPPPTTQSTSTYSAETDLVRDGGRLKIMRQNPTLRAVIQQAVEILHGDIVMINAFPMADQRGQFIRGALVSATNGRPAATEIRRRVCQDDDYVVAIVPILTARISLFRGEVKSLSDNHVATMYHLGLPGADAGQDPGQAAEEALHNYTYTYPRTGQGSLVGSVRRSQPYRHPICAAIAKELYGGTSINSFVQRHMARFPYTVNPENEKHELEMPPSMVALIFTAVYASLYEWRSGERRPVEFSANMFTDAYHGHIATLKHIKDNRPDAYHKMMHYLWLTAFGSVPQTEPLAMTSMAVIDLDALE